MSREEARSRLGIPPDAPLLLSVWGSLGSDHMNEITTDFVPLAVREKRFRMIHSAGKRGYAKLSGAVEAQCSEAERRAAGVEIREYIYDMPLVMAAADLIVCRSGASTLAELEALGKPALLIPSPNVTNNHQEKNARALAAVGAARVLTEGEFDAARLFREITALLGDRDALVGMGRAMRSCGVDDATGRIAELILSFVRE